MALTLSGRALAPGFEITVFPAKPVASAVPLTDHTPNGSPNTTMRSVSLWLGSVSMVPGRVSPQFLKYTRCIELRLWIELSFRKPQLPQLACLC